MGTEDITRSIFNPRKHYSGVRMQQGRVLTDDDWNEGAQIAEEDLRRSRVDIIGPAGSPDDGFKITDPTITGEGKINFSISPGTFYLGGMRLEMEGRWHDPVDLDNIQTYRLQNDWLQFPADPVLQAVEDEGPHGDRFDLVYLMAYQVPGTAVEDNELLEVALGGPDTTARMRTVNRIVVEENVDRPDCSRAWSVLKSRRSRGSFVEDNELIPDVNLKVTPIENGDGDLCTPEAAGGYLGAENQAIRVQLAGGRTFTWGFDNGAHLYRVTLNSDRQTVTLLNEPKDEAHRPRAGQVVEILPWAAVLPNNEKISENCGYLTKIISDYDPVSHEITLGEEVPENVYGELTYCEGRSDSHLLIGEEGVGYYFFMRVWDRGSDLESVPAVPFTPGDAVRLGHTGLQVTISSDLNHFITGDYWIIAARPETPNQVVPWELEIGRHPHGIRRYFVPLAVIHWQFDDRGNQLDPIVHDCRPIFGPLTRLKTCCSIIVGDGWSSHGHCNSIEEAISRLPLRSGGDICLLPGVHKANVQILGRFNITIKGCGLRTIVIPKASGDEGDGTPSSIFSIVDSWYITLENMTLLTWGRTAIQMEGANFNALQRIIVRDNHIFAFRNGIHAHRGRHIHIQRNIIRMWDRARDGGHAAIFLLAMQSLVECNNVGVLPVPFIAETLGDGIGEGSGIACAEDEEIENTIANNPNALITFANSEPDMPADPYRAQGGIQIGSGSERVKILENRIIGGAGNGVTLGSTLDLSIFDITSASDDLHEIHTSERRPGISGFVQSEDKQRLEGITFAFMKDGDKAPIIVSTGWEGIFNVPDVEIGRSYSIYVAYPNYIITGLLDITDEVNSLFYQITVKSVKSETELLNTQSEIAIEGNHISGMGLSGIGTPQVNMVKLFYLWTTDEGRKLFQQNPPLVLASLLAYQFGVLSGFVLDLDIHRNHITRCLQAPSVLGDAERIFLSSRGEGGVSLGWCENVTIYDNTIEENGPNHTHPVCGIFLSCGAQVDISQNKIINNGPIITGDTILQPGIRGGIVLKMVMALMIGGAMEDLAEGFSAPVGISANMGGHAARIDSNLVKQPVGQALRIIAKGPVSVMNNQFIVDVANTFTVQPIGQRWMEHCAAAALIVNVGRNARDDNGEDSGPMIFHTLFPGHTLFGHNRTRLIINTGSLASQVLMTLDDLGFDSNQSEVLTELEGHTLITNTYLSAFTLRANLNRLEEPLLAFEDREEWSPNDKIIPDRFSLWTVSKSLNHTINNQGNHCIKAASADGRSICSDNLSLGRDRGECKEVGGC